MPDRVVMRDSPAIRNHGIERRVLDCETLRAELARLAERVDREMGRGAVGIDMRKAAGDLALATSRLKDRIFGRALIASSLCALTGAPVCALMSTRLVKRTRLSLNPMPDQPRQKPPPREGHDRQD
jgi:hypothetical protein